MCFKNLPIEFDAQGKPFLRAGVANPYGPSSAAPRGAPAQLTAERIEDLLKRNGYIKDLDFDPVTRVAGALAFHTVADFRARKVLEARSMATLFRGYEVIMVGRDPRDAIFITSRACGVCGGVHSIARHTRSSSVCFNGGSPSGSSGPVGRSSRARPSCTTRSRESFSPSRSP